MITAQRKEIQLAKEALMVALMTSTVAYGKHWMVPAVSDDTLEKAVITALNIMAKDAVNIHECVVASDVLHIDDFRSTAPSDGALAALLGRAVT